MAIEDQIDYFMFDHDKYMFSGRSGKQRSKRETTMHTNRFDPNGHSRKLLVKLRNTEIKRRCSTVSTSLPPSTPTRKPSIVQSSQSIKQGNKSRSSRLIIDLI